MNQPHIQVNSELLKDILGLAKDTEIILEERTYTTEKVYPVLDPTASALQVSTLTAIVDYLKENKDELELDKLIVHVDGHNRVTVNSNLFGDFRQRETLMIANPILPDYDLILDRRRSTEQFIPAIQSMFLDSEHKTLLLDMVAHVRIESSADLQDDGIAQAVTIKKGAMCVGGNKFPNPVVLKPYSTFPEVNQPERLFTFRMSEDAGCTLIEADGGAWKAVAAQIVAKYLKENLPEGVTVIA